ncbi:MAG: LysR family transcriptional regulator [Rhizobiaceae bacterium]|nr:LysR family transcriptional regulator [Rhizobiaceae bacterium]
MNLDSLSLFVDATRLGSFAAVARERNADPSAVSRTIAGLEAELGARLFNRTTRSMSLTEAGERFHARVAHLTEELNHAREEARSTRAAPAGLLRMTASVAFGQAMIVPLLGKFRKRYPNIRIELQLTDANIDLVAERIDLAVRLAPSYRADLVGTRLIPTRYRAVASPSWIERSGGIARPEELANRRCLLFSLPEFRERWKFRRDDRVTEVPVDGDIVMSSALAIRTAALAGLGPALLADWLIGGDLAAGDLVDLLPEHEAAATSFDTAAWLLYPSRSHLPAKVRAAIDFFRGRIVAGATPAP